MSLIKNQPKGFAILFLTEMWERFGFYVVQGLLVLYMTEYFGFSDDKSYTILGIFTAFVYIAPFIGGALADRVLGFHPAIVWGGLLFILGYFLLALPYDALFYPALATIVIGNGLFKPNVSSLLGDQYLANDHKRDAGFTLFYIGINLGAFLAGFSSGYIKDHFGWHVCFMLSSIGLVIGVCTFLYGLKLIENKKRPKNLNLHFNVKFLIYCLLAICALSYIFTQAVTGWLLAASGILMLFFLIFLTAKQPLEHKRRMVMLNTLIISSTVFFMLYLQIFNSVNLYVDRLVDKQLFGLPYLTISTTIFYASESVFIILLGPLFALFWQHLASSQRIIHPINKFALGLFFTGLAFVVLAASTHSASGEHLINPMWIFSAYFLITVGELLLSPIGLAAVTELAPSHLVGMMMGVYMAAAGFGGLFAGMIAKIASVPLDGLDMATKLAIYRHAFIDYALIGFAAALLLFCIGLGAKYFLQRNIS